MTRTVSRQTVPPSDYQLGQVISSQGLTALQRAANFAEADGTRQVLVNVECQRSHYAPALETSSTFAEHYRLPVYLTPGHTLLRWAAKAFVSGTAVYEVQLWSGSAQIALVTFTAGSSNTWLATNATTSLTGWHDLQVRSRRTSGTGNGLLYGFALSERVEAL